MPLPDLDDFSPREITSTFDKLGQHLKDIKFTGGHPSNYNEFHSVRNIYILSILKRCHNVTRLNCDVPKIALDTLVASTKHLPLLLDLTAYDIKTTGMNRVKPLMNALCEHCPALKSLQFSAAPNQELLYDRTVFDIKGLVSLTLTGEPVLEADFYRDLALLTSLTLADADEVPEEVRISCNSVLQCLTLKDMQAIGDMKMIEIERCTALQRVVAVQSDHVKFYDVCFKFRECPSLTSLYVKGEDQELRNC
mmetsp:Transcript_20472/g.34144  ORF Transcript_20472/g.34144 Transcript_20472/m.34144 type:complete len:251 (+) Transcript_20472:497-1249(+)